MSTTIDMQDIGPIEQLSIPVPTTGGVVVLRGGQGVGKSTALGAVSKTMGGRAKLSPRDGAKRGEVEFGEARLTVTQSRSTRRGELEVAELESRLDISALVDPGIDNPESADSKRIKALALLSGVKADASMFYKLVGGQVEFEKIGVDIDTDDPVLLAGRVKRAIEQEARKIESLRDTEKGHASAFHERIGDIDLDAECDAEVLQSALESAIAQDASLKEAVEAANRADTAAEEAKAELELAQAEGGQSLADAQAVADRCRGDLDAAQAEVAALTDQLAAATRERDALRQRVHEADHRALEASKREQMLDTWRRTIESQSQIHRPTDEDLAEAADVLTKAREQHELGAKVRDAKEMVNNAQRHRERAKFYDKRAQRYRDAAKDTDVVLSDAIPSDRLRVEGGRLVTKTRRGKSTLFDELSHGEKWKMAIDLASEQLPANGVLTIPQEAWAALEDANKTMIHEYAVSKVITIITAEVTTGPLEVGSL